MEIAEQKAIELITSYAPQVGEGNNWSLLIEAIKKLREEEKNIPIKYLQFYEDLLEDINWVGLITLDYEKTFWAVAEAINFINDLKNEEK